MRLTRGGGRELIVRTLTAAAGCSRLLGGAYGRRRVTRH